MASSTSTRWSRAPKAQADALTRILQDYFKKDGEPIAFAVLQDSNVASVDIFNSLKPKLDGRFAKLVAKETWTPPVSDASAASSAVLRKDPDAIFLNATSTTDAALVLRQLRSQGSRAPVIMGAASAANPTFLKTAGATAMEGLFLPIEGFPGKGSEEIVKQYTARTGEPFMGPEALTGYTNVWVLAKAIEAAKSTDPAKVETAMDALNLVDFAPLALLPGGTTVKFGANGRRESATAEILQWQDGEPRVLSPPELATAKAKLRGRPGAR